MLRSLALPAALGQATQLHKHVPKYYAVQHRRLNARELYRYSRPDRRRGRYQVGAQTLDLPAGAAVRIACDLVTVQEFWHVTSNPRYIRSSLCRSPSRPSTHSSYTSPSFTASSTVAVRFPHQVCWLVELF